MRHYSPHSKNKQTMLSTRQDDKKNTGREEWNRTAREGRPQTARPTHNEESPFKIDRDTEYQSRFSPHKINPTDMMPIRSKKTKREYKPSPHKL